MHRRPAVVPVLAAVVTAVLLGLAPGASAQTPEVAFDVRPAPGSSTDDGGGWFALPLPAGGSVEQAVTVHNTSDAPLELALDAVDATTMAVGGASYAPPGEPATRTATWVDLPEPVLRLAPDERRTVPFTVRAPADALPGDHLAGISIASPSTTGESTTLDNGASTSIDLRTRRVIAVHVTVPGPAEAGVAVRGVEAAVRPPGPQLEIALENTGRLLTRGRGVLTLPDDDVRLEFDLDTFVPGTSIAYPLPWPEGLAEGTRPVRVELEHDGRTVTWEGEVSVSDDAVEAAQEVAVPAAPGTASAAGPAGSSGIPPLVLGLAVLGGIGVAVAGQLLLRLTRRPSAGAA